MGKSLPYVHRAVLVATLLFVPNGVLPQPRNCLRVMPPEELTKGALIIARAKVTRSDKARYEGTYSQIATLVLNDTIEGDFTLREVLVFARSNVRCADDNYTEGQEMLVFLVPERGLYHTLNFQYGQFQIVGEMVKSWRNKTNLPSDKPYVDVRREIEAYLTPPAKQGELMPAESVNTEKPGAPGQTRPAANGPTGDAKADPKPVPGSNGKPIVPPKQ
ncbi:MAG TPA: hypothetical protein VFV34_02260 [Blastocatellia bacterium]|nr:hypothetical protein [Blastocatellia bacterium]